jgi:hypothetical protein
VIRVYVYTHHEVNGRPRRVPMVLTYTTYQTEGACIHDVEARNGYEAKRVALREHRTRCLALAEGQS